jgi:hypothetical protein
LIHESTRPINVGESMGFLSGIREATTVVVKRSDNVDVEALPGTTNPPPMSEL